MPCVLQLTRWVVGGDGHSMVDERMVYTLLWSSDTSESLKYSGRMVCRDVHTCSDVRVRM